jgi:predicted site-specific integrase-resolvase
MTSSDLPFDMPDELDDIAEQAEEVGKLTPREFAQLIGVAPQMVYYYIRNGRINVERCICGRKVIDVETAKAVFAKTTEARGEGMATRFASASDE